MDYISNNIMRLQLTSVSSAPVIFTSRIWYISQNKHLCWMKVDTSSAPSVTVTKEFWWNYSEAGAQHTQFSSCSLFADIEILTFLKEKLNVDGG